MPRPSEGSPTEEDALKAILCSPNFTYVLTTAIILLHFQMAVQVCRKSFTSRCDDSIVYDTWLQESIRNNLIETVDTIDNKLTDGYDSGYIESDVNLATLNVTRYLFDSKPWGNANSAICNASIHAKDLFESINVRVVTFDTFGSDGAKVINISPDALVQWDCY